MRNLIMPLLAGIATLILCASPTYADLGDQLFKLLPDDGAADDRFGISVAISGTTAIIGAWTDDDNGGSSGSAYLFDTTTGQQLFKLLADDGAANDIFGSSVGISGITAIVGARSHGDNGEESGAAYLFDTTTGLQSFELLPDDGNQFAEFGGSVAISGISAIVGAHFDIATGSAYLFDAPSGTQIDKLLANDGESEDVFGFSVAISGTIAIVGARNDNDNGKNSGSAYLFDTTTGKQLFKLLPKDGAEGDLFGRSVGISGTTAIVGAHLNTDKDFDDFTGSAYLFDTTTGEQIAKIMADDAALGDHFGFSVAIKGTTAIVGAYSNDDNGNNSGSAYLYDISDTVNPVQIAKLLADDGAAGDSFGYSVAISGTSGKEVAIVGALHDDDNGTNSGSAYLFDAAFKGKCPWDLHGDGNVGLGDLLILLGWWCCDPNGPPDFNGDGIVNTTDLLELFANWGPCG